MEDQLTKAELGLDKKKRKKKKCDSVRVDQVIIKYIWKIRRDAGRCYDMNYKGPQT